MEWDGMGWICLAQVRDQWRALVNSARGELENSFDFKVKQATGLKNVFTIHILR
jgi:hypothetical protein